MPITEDVVYEALKQVKDPELFVNVVDLGLIYEVRTEQHDDKTDVYVKMTMTSPACPAGPQMVQDVKDTLAKLSEEIGAVEVEVTLSPPWTPDRMTEEARDELGMF
ncbi:MAG: metal-sulfur cluster assembly factor [Planctomycetota bacterium]|nr:MAG: metal-sulfur cluster assembly factor [Planctomycetota bacterium]